MPDARRDLVKRLFEEARARPDGTWEAWLATACADDNALFVEVASLVRADRQAGSFMVSPGLASPGAAEAILQATAGAARSRLEGRQVGPYRIVREIGRGGMGVVYLGVRADETFDKAVAIKIVPEWSHPSLFERFLEERRILAALDHPNIARLLDAGKTDDGTPFVVMEYVEGTPIDVYAREHRLAVRKRLELFCAVCDAVQYSHQRLIVHRDIKPGNILVAADGTPKLLDFGIARLLDPAGVTAGTRTDFRVLTPQSASPEQVRGEEVTVASDVYSLGVLLYVLLTDRSPYGSSARTDVEMVRAICHDTPRRPSDIVAVPAVQEAPAPPAAARQIAERRKELLGDLDVITLKALSKEPARRYPSVERLAADVRRHLRGEPVEAVPDSFRYRTGKFLARHRAGAAAAATVAAALGLATAVSLVEARVARRERAVALERFQMVRTLADAVIFEFNDALDDVPGSTPARRLIVSRAIEYLKGLSRQQTADPDLARQLAASYVKIGDIQGNAFASNLGDAAGARASYSKALELYAQLSTLSPGHAADAGMATAHRSLGMLDWAAGDLAAARGHFEKMLRFSEGAARGTPPDPLMRRLAADALYMLGQTALRAADGSTALARYQAAADIYLALAAATPNDDGLQASVARVYMKLGDAAESLGKDPFDYFKKAADTMDAVLRRPSAKGEARRVAAYAWLRVAESLIDGLKPAEAERYAKRAADFLLPVAAKAPTDVRATSDASTVGVLLGDALLEQRRFSEAGAALASGLEAAERVLRINPGYMEGRRMLGEILAELGSYRLATNDLAGAAAVLQRALPVLETEPVRSQSTEHRAIVYLRLGDVHAARARAASLEARERERAEAAACYAKSRDIWTTMQADAPLTPRERLFSEEVSRKALQTTLAASSSK